MKTVLLGIVVVFIGLLGMYGAISGQLPAMLAAFFSPANLKAA